MNTTTHAAVVVADNLDLAGRLIAYMEAKGYTIARNPGEVNIVYLEGSNADGSPNADRIDEWNDRRIVIQFQEGKPVIALNCEATTEPGLKPTLSKQAKVRGGIARVQFGQFAVWQMGYHQYAKYGPLHPALVQRAPLKVHRDANADGKRTGDPLWFASGINQHGTREGYTAPRVDGWSEGCLVARSWILHSQFIWLCKQDPRYKADPLFMFPTTIIAGDDFARWK